MALRAGRANAHLCLQASSLIEMNLDTKENLRKILFFCFLLLVSITTFMSIQVLAGDEDLIESLKVLVGLVAFVPYMALQTVLFTYVDRMKINKILRRLIFIVLGTMETGFVLAILALMGFEGFDANFAILLTILAFFGHLVASLAVA